MLVNPLQALHPNEARPGFNAGGQRPRRQLRPRGLYGVAARGCARCAPSGGIVLIFDEVFLGFRLARGGAQEYFGVHADMVTYGKTVAGGLPIGVLCGRADLMKRFREDRPADVCFARGTFNSHPYVMGAMAEFLERLDTPEILACIAIWMRSGTAGPPARTSGCARPGCRCRWPIYPRCGRWAICSRRATTGCFSITCAPKTWR